MKWLTVEEVAEYLKLSEQMIYKLAQQGEIPAAKVGRVWRFSADQIDAWLLQQHRAEAVVPQHIKRIIDDIFADLKKQYGEDLVSLYLFGSFARGDAHPDSDLDLLIVLKSVDQSADDKKVNDIAYRNTYEKGRMILCAPFVMSEAEFLTGGSSLLLNIRKDGVKAA